MQRDWFLCMVLSMLHYVNYFRVLYFVVVTVADFFFSIRTQVVHSVIAKLHEEPHIRAHLLRALICIHTKEILKRSTL